MTRGFDATGSSVYQWTPRLARESVVTPPLIETGGLPLGQQVQGIVGGKANMVAAPRWPAATFRANEI